MPRAVVSLLILSGMVSGCRGPASPSTVTATCAPSAATARAAMPFFGTPFVGDFPTGNSSSRETLNDSQAVAQTGYGEDSIR
jgi:hypothetical protein